MDLTSKTASTSPEGPATGRIDADRDYQDRDPSDTRRPFAEHGDRHECGRNRLEGDEGSRVLRTQETDRVAMMDEPARDGSFGGMKTSSGGRG